MAQYSGNIIPTMTSNTTPIPIVISSSTQYSTTFAPWKAFDRSNATHWMTPSGTLQGWVKIDLGSQRKIGRYSLSSSTDTGNLPVTANPKNWTLEGSNSELFSGEQDVLHTVSNEQAWTPGLKRIYDFDNQKSYRYYRINITSNQGYANFMGFAELEMMELIISNKILLSSGDKYISMKKGMLIDSNVIPAHSSNTSPTGGIVNTNNTVSSTAYTLFDGNSSNNLTFGLMTNVWVSYEFPSPKKIGKYTLIVTGASSINRAPREWKFEGSNDGVTWTQLDYQNESSNNWTMGVKRSFTITNTIKFKIYRVFIVLSNNGSSTAPSLSEIEMMGMSPNELYDLDALNENTVLNYGLDTPINLTEVFTKAKVIKSTNNTVSSGKTFEHSIDMSKRRVDKITLG